jgi:hypothetical protein
MYFQSKGGRTSKPINPVLVSIGVAVQRIYCSVDNPYTPTIAFLMLTWTLHKISVFERLGSANRGWLRALDILYDCFLLSVLMYTGVVVQVRAYEGMQLWM